MAACLVDISTLRPLIISHKSRVLVRHDYRGSFAVAARPAQQPLEKSVEVRSLVRKFQEPFHRLWKGITHTRAVRNNHEKGQFGPRPLQNGPLYTVTPMFGAEVLD